jgi:hypothetical protein
MLMEAEEGWRCSPKSQKARQKVVNPLSLVKTLYSKMYRTGQKNQNILFKIILLLLHSR